MKKVEVFYNRYEYWHANNRWSGGMRCSNAQRTSNRTANPSASHWSRPPRPPHKPLSLPNSPIPATLPNKHTPAYARTLVVKVGKFKKSDENNLEDAA
jgi:hypothetical protein